MARTHNAHLDHVSSIIQARRLALQVAGESMTDPRSVAREMRDPGSVRGHAGLRIRQVLIARGLVPASTGTAAISMRGAQIA